MFGRELVERRGHRRLLKSPANGPLADAMAAGALADDLERGAFRLQGGGTGGPIAIAPGSASDCPAADFLRPAAGAGGSPDWEFTVTLRISGKFKASMARPRVWIVTPA
jgi:hypothetical protein